MTARTSLLKQLQIVGAQQVNTKLQQYSHDEEGDANDDFCGERTNHLVPDFTPTHPAVPIPSVASVIDDGGGVVLKILAHCRVCISYELDLPPPRESPLRSTTPKAITM